MSSVSITQCAFKRSGATVTGDVTFEATFAPWEVGLNLGYTPTIVVTPSVASTAAIFIPAGMGKVNLVRGRKEVACPLPIIRPDGRTKVVGTCHVSVQLGQLFNYGYDASFNGPNTGMDARIDLKPEIAPCGHTLSAQPISTAPATTIAAPPPGDTTDDLKGIIGARGDNGPGEGKDKAFDNQSGSKWLDFSPQGSWIQYTYAAGLAGHLTSYTLTSAGDAPERDPADWQLLGSNDGGSSWTVVDSRTGVAFGDRLQRLTFALSSAPTYRTYRLNITRVQNPASANSLQLGELELLGQQVTTPVPCDTTDDHAGTITARGDNGPGEGKEKAYDNQRDTKWLDFSPQGSWIQYSYAAGIAGRLSGYALTSAGDAPERDPADWQMLGSNDGGASWTVLDSQTGIVFGDRLQRLTFPLTAAPTYNAYRLNITKVLDPSVANSLQLAGLELLGQRVTCP